MKKTGFDVSEIGLGAWQLGGDWGTVEEGKAMEILNTAVDNGINFIDTADVYGQGRSEELIGKFLKTNSEDIFVATKLGRLKGYPDDYSFELFRECTEASLRRLGKETLDLTQLHCIPTDYMKNGEVFDWLRELQSEGKIRYFGASVESMEEAHICLEQDDLASLQVIFNIFRQKPIKNLFETAQAKNVALIIRVPLASGLLTGKFKKESVFPPDDHRNFNKDGQMFNVGETFAGIKFEKGVELAERLKDLKPPSASMAQFALRWILDYDAVDVVIPGAKNQDQVLMNIGASDMQPLSDKIHQQLESFYQNKVKDLIRGPY
jgi:aryl-alcohol dehydrogenase-like predicted oxidoreductase